jgi:hypothetical protein
VGGVSTRLFATHANILSSFRSTTPHDVTSTLKEMLLYHSLINQKVRIFGTKLSPDKFSARNNLISELLRYL